MGEGIEKGVFSQEDIEEHNNSRDGNCRQKERAPDEMSVSEELIYCYPANHNEREEITKTMSEDGENGKKNGEGAKEKAFFFAVVRAVEGVQGEPEEEGEEGIPTSLA